MMDASYVIRYSKILIFPLCCDTTANVVNAKEVLEKNQRNRSFNAVLCYVLRGKE